MNREIGYMENKMKTYLGTEYQEENHVLNWLLYWKKAENTKNKSDEWRMENELDCLYLGCLEADTIISVFQILKRLIISINPQIKLGTKKDVVEILIEKDNFERLLPKEDLLVQQLQILAYKAELRQNFMLLPDRKMQKRGISYADEMAPTLYQCFDNGGVYREYFKYDDKEVENWVKCQKLQMLFENNIIDIKHIKPMIEGYSPKQSFKKTTKRENLLKLIKYSIDLLDERAKKFE
jgi:hypothetical protein